MTLTELLPAIQRLTATDKLKLIRVLAEELDVPEDISPLLPHKLYYLPTPYETFGAGRALLDAMAVADRDNH
jgi:hypothetical protein